MYIITIQEFRTSFLAISFEMVHKMSQAILKTGKNRATLKLQMIILCTTTDAKINKEHSTR